MRGPPPSVVHHDHRDRQTSAHDRFEFAKRETDGAIAGDTHNALRRLGNRRSDGKTEPGAHATKSSVREVTAAQVELQRIEEPVFADGPIANNPCTACGRDV